MTAKPRAFLLLMHKRGNRWLTQSDYEQQAKDSITADVFQKLASRSNVVYEDLPKALWPFFHYRDEVVGGNPEPTYRAAPSRDRIVIEGVAEGQGVSNDDVDWSILLQPPPDAPESQSEATQE